MRSNSQLTMTRDYYRLPLPSDQGRSPSSVVVFLRFALLLFFDLSFDLLFDLPSQLHVFFLQVHS